MQMPEAGKAVFGVELECLVPASKIKSSEIGGHNEGLHYVDGWVAEHDGSLNPYSSEHGVEFVSPIFSLDKLDETFEPLIRKLDTNVRIDKSCGCHIHFSWIPEGRKSYNPLYMQTPIRTLEWIRKTVHSRVRENFPSLYYDFESQYFRGYAKQRSKLEYMEDHESEFSFTSNQGIEWRSFNLKGATKWDQIKGMVRLGCQTVQDALDEQMFDQHQFVIQPHDDKGSLKAMEWSIFDKAGIEIVQR